MQRPLGAEDLNRDVGFSLTDDDMDALAALERGERTGTHPDERQ